MSASIKQVDNDETVVLYIPKNKIRTQWNKEDVDVLYNLLYTRLPSLVSDAVVEKFLTERVYFGSSAFYNRLFQHLAKLIDFTLGTTMTNGQKQIRGIED